MTNPTGAENAQVQDDADRIVLEWMGENDVVLSFGAAAALMIALREAEQREAIVWEFAVARHVGGSATRDLVKATANDPEYRNRAIERATTPK